MAALKSVNRMYGVCFHAARQAAGLKASRLVQHRTFKISVSYGSITSLRYSHTSLLISLHRRIIQLAKITYNLACILIKVLYRLTTFSDCPMYALK